MPAADTHTAAMSTELYLASTPLHILNAIAIASQRPQTQAHLVLIDQPDAQDNPYFKILSDWPSSPFKSLDIYQGRIKGIRQKLANRKAVFAKLDALIQQLNPQRIYTGNDRRIEFQYAMHAQYQRNKKRAEGVYMDEGTFTYVGRKDSASFSDKYIDNVLKKLTYGFWWKNPLTIGGSDWIDRVVVAFPDQLHPLLKSKIIEPLSPYYEHNPTVKSFCEALLTFFQADATRLHQLNVVLTLPHESIIDGITGYREALLAVVDSLTTNGLTIGVKYHPRNTNPDILGLANSDQAYVISHRIPFEAILPLLNHCLVIGDVSSTLINTRFLLPQAQAISIANPQAPLYQEFMNLFACIGVHTTQAESLMDLVQSLLSSTKD